MKSLDNISLPKAISPEMRDDIIIEIFPFHKFRKPLSRLKSKNFIVFNMCYALLTEIFNFLYKNEVRANLVCVTRVENPL